MSKLDIARALRDKQYFNSLSDEEKARVRAEGGLDESEITDEDLESVSGGLEGGVSAQDTTTSTDVACNCSDGCVCTCDDNKV